MSRLITSSVILILQLNINLSNPKEIIYVDQTQNDWHVGPIRQILQQRNIPFNAQDFSSHGCWCSNNMKGGKPVTALDNLCHQLQQCLRCVEMDDECSEYTTFWLMDMDASITSEKVNLACYNNYDSCMKKKCECTEHVFEKIAEQLKNHPNSESDINAVCPSHLASEHHHTSHKIESENAESVHKFTESSAPSEAPSTTTTTEMSTTTTPRTTTTTTKQPEVTESPTLLQRAAKIPAAIVHEVVESVIKVEKFIEKELGFDVEEENITEEQDDVPVLINEESAEPEKQDINPKIQFTANELKIEQSEAQPDNEVQENESIPADKVAESLVAAIHSNSQTVEANTKKPLTEREIKIISSIVVNNEQSVIVETDNIENPLIQTVASSSQGLSSNDHLLYKTAGIKANHDKCCGAHPEWFPYNSHNGQRDCCNKKTFDVFSLKCCSDGSIIGKSGTCSDQKDEELKPESEQLTVIPTCDAGTEQLVLSGSSTADMPIYECAAKEANTCRSTEMCKYSEKPTCGSMTRLVSYKIDDCCRYYYCAPIVPQPGCSASVCQDDQVCSKYKVKTTSLLTFMNCCPDNECICDYNKCPKKPVCSVGKKLLTLKGEECCDEYKCV